MCSACFTARAFRSRILESLGLMAVLSNAIHASYGAALRNIIILPRNAVAVVVGLGICRSVRSPGLSAETADYYYQTIDAALKRSEFRPRALFERFNIEVIATTESPLDPLNHHRQIRESAWGGRIVTSYRPDSVVDWDTDHFRDNLARFGELTGSPLFRDI